jgi:hypothetical protein
MRNSEKVFQADSFDKIAFDRSGWSYNKHQVLLVSYGNASRQLFG